MSRTELQAERDKLYARIATDKARMAEIDAELARPDVIRAGPLVMKRHGCQYSVIAGDVRYYADTEDDAWTRLADIAKFAAGNADISIRQAARAFFSRLVDPGEWREPTEADRDGRLLLGKWGKGADAIYDVTYYENGEWWDQSSGRTLIPPHRVRDLAPLIGGGE